LGLFVPRGFDTEGDAKYIVDELGLTFDFATDRRAEITARYDVEVFPTTFFIDKTGRVSAKATGALNQARLTRIIEKMVNN
jgi:cytochrome c biogenesis protein CcmG/thiol:disulfide interchange protein DsbE